MYCKKCNALMPPKAIFCGKCAAPMRQHTNPINMNNIFNNAPANTMLKIIGVLFIILGMFNLFVGLINLIAQRPQVLIIVGILAACYSILCGILMLMYSNRLDKSQILLYNAIGRTTLYIIFIFAILITIPEMFTVLLIVVSLIEAPLCILFMIGSLRNNNI